MWLCEGPAINTGDWDRVTISAGFLAPPWEPMQSHYTLDTPAQFSNNSSLGVLLSTLGWLTQRTGHDTLATAPILLALLLALLAGSFSLARHACGHGHWLVLTTLALVLLCYAVYLKSFYGEALVLALAPALCVGIKQLVQQNRILLFTLCAAAIIYAKQQMLFVAPIIILLLLRNMWLHGGANLRLWASLLCIIFVSATTLGAHSENRAPNQYNRYFNGVGWSILQSANWPAQRFDERHPYFYKYQQQLQASLAVTLPHYSYLGTSYLPTASTILDAARHPEYTEARKEEAQALYDQLIAEGRLGNYLATLAQHPAIVWQLINNTYLTAVRSNYIVAYTRSAVQLPPAAAQALAVAQAQLAHFFGWIFIATLLLALACNRSRFSAIITAWMLLAPLAIVVGDGYFEFEKHMTAFFVFLPCALMAALLKPPKHLPPTPNPPSFLIFAKKSLDFRFSSSL